MNRISKFFAAMALGAIVFSPAASAQKKKKDDKAAKETPKLNVSKEFVAAFVPANDALEKTQDAAAAKALFPAVQALSQSDDEKVQAGVLGFKIGLALKDQAFQKQAIDLALSSATVAAPLRTTLQFQRGAIAYDTKDYATAQRDFVAVYQAGYRENNIEINIANSYQRLNNPAEALNWLQKSVDAALAKGAVPERGIFGTAINIAAKSKNPASVANWGQQFIRYHPRPDAYRDAVIIFDSVARMPTQEALDLMRLVRMNKGLLGELEYKIYVENVDAKRYPAEAMATMEEGFAAGTMQRNNAFFAEQMAIAKENIGVLSAGWDQDEKSALANPKGMQASLFADLLLSFGQHARAQKMYEAALQKGGIVDREGKDQTDRTRMRLGIAKVMQGNNAGAKPDFSGMTTPDRKTIAGFWLAHLATKGV
jgi:hypothetical protein